MAETSIKKGEEAEMTFFASAEQAPHATVKPYHPLNFTLEELSRLLLLLRKYKKKLHTLG